MQTLCLCGSGYNYYTDIKETEYDFAAEAVHRRTTKRDYTAKALPFLHIKVPLLTKN